MVIARAQARSLLTVPEMVLFGDSRNPTLRSFDERELTRRIDRVRKLRDKSRDLLQRQRLSSRERTGNKGGKSGGANERTARKAEVLDDVLQRFEKRVRELEGTGQPGTGKKAPPATARKRAVTDSTAKARKKPPRGAAAKKSAGAAKSAGTAKKISGGAKRPAVKKSSAAAEKAGSGTIRKVGHGPSATPGKTVKKPATAAGRRPRKRSVTAEQALASTLELLEAKQQRHKKPRGYPGDGDAAHSEPAYPSVPAKAKAVELHAGEIRMASIHGSISTHDRKNQAKRDRS